MSSPYLPNTDTDRSQMLREIGVGAAEELFRDIPEELRNARFNLPAPLSELELKDELRRLAALNTGMDDYACFLGAGYYRHFIPGVIGHITGRSEFYTAYTPYQPEISQGTLQAIYEYQSLVCQLTGMEVSNAGMYDGSTAAAEAVLMACRITGREKAAVLATVNPAYTEVIATYTGGGDISVARVDPAADSLPSGCACLVAQQPGFCGYFEDMTACARIARDAGALLIVIVDPVSLGMFKSPADYGADIIVAEGQALGNPVSFGGPALGIFTCRKKYLRQMPGRIAGKTMDVDGKTGYVLTMQTREQHIRRERSTSNICTNEALVALAVVVYLATLGKTGLRRVAELCYHKAHYAADKISRLKGYSPVSSRPFFNEFAVHCPAAPRRVNEALREEGIIGGLDISDIADNGMLLCVTEVNTRQQIDKLVQVLGEL
ncbi:aminomethyl-transferring glycine dehydrogenase subunit GcvPA [Chloroflexota bacterium]